MRLGLVDTSCKTQLGRAGALEDDKLRLEEDIAVDGEADAGVGLDTAEAGCARSVSIYDTQAHSEGVMCSLLEEPVVTGA